MTTIEAPSGALSESLPFQDLNSFNGTDWYAVPNEDPSVLRELVKSKYVDTAAAICSAGEVGLFCLLPTVRKKLVLVDHSYRSLSVAMRKYLLLKHHGAKKARAAINDGAGEVLDNYRQFLPKCMEDWRAVPTLGGRNNYNAMSIKRYWSRIPSDLIDRACEKLDLVEFVHGDLTDLIERGPFDLLYISNAMEHRSRYGDKPLPEQIQKIVKPGGYIISTQGQYSTAVKKAKWIESDSRVSTNSSYLTWDYKVWQTPTN